MFRWIDNYIEQIEEMTPPKTELGSKSDTTLDSLDLDGPVEPYQVFHKGERRLEGEEGPSDPDGLDPLAARSVGIACSRVFTWSREVTM